MILVNVKCLLGLIFLSTTIYFGFSVPKEIDIIVNYKTSSCKIKNDQVYSNFECNIDCKEPHQNCSKNLTISCENEYKWSNGKDPETCHPFCPELKTPCCNNSQFTCNLICPISYYINVLIYIDKVEYKKVIKNEKQKLLEYINLLNNKRCYYDVNNKDILLNDGPSWKFMLFLMFLYLTVIQSVFIIYSCFKRESDNHQEQGLLDGLLPSYGSIIHEDTKQSKWKKGKQRATDNWNDQGESSNNNHHYHNNHHDVHHHDSSQDCSSHY